MYFSICITLCVHRHKTQYYMHQGKLFGEYIYYLLKPGIDIGII